MPRLLLVDDNPDLSDLLREFLTFSGHQVAQAASGTEALAALGIEPPGELKADLALVDRNMPGMSGDELVERLRAEPKTRELPVIFLSGTPELPPDGAKVRSIRKPFDPPQILKLIKELLP